MKALVFILSVTLTGCSAAYWQGVRERMADLPESPVVTPVVTPAKGWYVTMIGGQLVAGPFVLVEGCNRIAAQLAQGDARVLTLCVYK